MTTIMTAREAQALADKLRADESDRQRRERDADRAARITTAQAQLEHADTLDTARKEAATAWQSTAANPAASLVELFDAFVTMRTTSAARARHVAHAGSAWDHLEPIRSDVSGQPIQHRSDVVDNTIHMDWTTALEQVVRQRVEAAEQAAASAVQAALDDAGERARKTASKVSTSKTKD